MRRLTPDQLVVESTAGGRPRSRCTVHKHNTASKAILTKDGRVFHVLQMSQHWQMFQHVRIVVFEPDGFVDWIKDIDFPESGWVQSVAIGEDEGTGDLWVALGHTPSGTDDDAPRGRAYRLHRDGGLAPLLTFSAGLGRLTDGATVRSRYGAFIEFGLRA